MTGQLGEILARIHAVPIDDRGLAALPGCRRTTAHPAAAELARYEQLYRTLAPEPHPVIEYGLRWLRRRVSRRAGGACSCTATIASATCSSGPRACASSSIGSRRTSAIRWRTSDGCACGPGGSAAPLPVGGIGEREEFFRAYERAGGGAVDPEVVRFWEALGDLKWAVICIAQAKTYLDGGVKSVELASIGRRTAEAEHDLLELVD